MTELFEINEISLIEKPVQPRPDWFIVICWWNCGKWWRCLPQQFLTRKKAEEFITTVDSGNNHFRIFKIPGEK